MSKPKLTTQAIAIDFDGVIHKYSKGWADGSCYDEPVEGAFDAIRTMMEAGFSVFILSTRDPDQIKEWLINKAFDNDYIWDGYSVNRYSAPLFGFTVQKIPFWKKFWTKPNVLGITKRKLKAKCYIDDRAITFNGVWDFMPAMVQNFKTYQDKGICKECGRNAATKDYNGHKHYVCNICYDSLSREFDKEYN